MDPAFQICSKYRDMIIVVVQQEATNRLLCYFRPKIKLRTGGS